MNNTEDIVYLNIGTLDQAGAKIDLGNLIDSVRGYFPQCIFALHTSDSEETLVVCLPDMPYVSDVLNLVRDLNQHAIAYWLDRGDQLIGGMAGPGARHYGPFDATKFLLLDGSRLAVKFNKVS